MGRNGETKSKTDDGEKGPSWWDVEDMYGRVMAKWGRDVTVTLVCTPRTRAPQARWDVTVAATARKGGTPGKPVKAKTLLRGQTGHRTVTSAIWHALFEVYNDLEAAEDAAEQAALF